MCRWWCWGGVGGAGFSREVASVAGISERWGQEPRPLDSVGLPVGEGLGTQEQRCVSEATDAKGQV